MTEKQPRTQSRSTIFKRISNPFNEFIRIEGSSGYLLLVATLISLLTANSSLGEPITYLLHAPIQFHIGNVFLLDFNIEQFVNDGLMTIFFVVVGLEIKRELIEGELSTKQQAMLPVIGALGGMFFPAIIYLSFNIGKESVSGWAIPTATDIAFSLAIIQLLGKKVPLSLKVFLTALAVVDDLGAIIVIAFFYAEQLYWLYLFFALLVTGVLFLMNKFNVRNVFLYLLVGIFLWIFFHYSGIHATISGVVLALFIPLRFKNDNSTFFHNLKKVKDNSGALNENPATLKSEMREKEEMRHTFHFMDSPLNYLLQKLHGTSSYFIMPLFAFCNAGIKLDFNTIHNLFSPISLGIFFGLLLGKTLGITLTTFVSSKFGITQIPIGVSTYDMFKINLLTGVGFTMSIFVTNLAFNNLAYIETAKLSIIITSLTAGVLGYVLNSTKK